MARTATSAVIWRGTALLSILALGLAGCDQFATPAAESDAAPATSVELVETDVEAPEIFYVTEEGLWDGSPSFGGVWVAHPDVAAPERVIIRNQDNGSFVIGALFRRERNNPGPTLQVSSDAAEALGMLAGDPTALNVTALRREEAAAPAPTEATLPPTDQIETTTLDPIAGAAAAIDAAEAAAPTATPAETPAAAPEITAAPIAGAPAASALERPYLQLGIFAIEANATNLAAEMEAKGLPSRVVAQQSQGRDFWRVLVGPAADSAQRAAWAEQVKQAGFADAYAVDN